MFLGTWDTSNSSTRCLLLQYKSLPHLIPCSSLTLAFLPHLVSLICSPPSVASLGGRMDRCAALSWPNTHTDTFLTSFLQGGQFNRAYEKTTAVQCNQTQRQMGKSLFFVFFILLNDTVTKNISTCIKAATKLCSSSCFRAQEDGWKFFVLTEE